MNRAGLDLIQADTLEQVQGQCVFPIVTEEYRAQFQSLLRDVFLGKSGAMEFRITGLRGRSGWLYSHMVPLRDATGKIISALSVTIDITARKTAEDELRESERKFHDLSIEFNTLLDAIPDELCLYSRDLRILWANRSVSSRTGRKREELGGHACYAVLHGRREPCAGCVVVRSLETGDEASDTVTSPDGTVWDVRAVPIRDEAGNVAKVVKVGRDITSQRKLEDELRQAQKMEAIGQLAGGVAHDFNNILTAIIGYGNIIQMKMGTDDNLRYYVEQILISAEKAASLTHSLLAFSRKQIINPKPLNLNETVHKVENLLRRLIGEDIELVVVPSAAAPLVLADSSQMEQILMNLATNARDALPAGGTLKISIETFQADESFALAHDFCKTGRYVLLSVADNGSGMDKKTRERIFEPFFTTKEMGKGTGLGLSMVYGIVRQHNGYIECQSAPGQGTVFTIYLPGLEPAVPEETANVTGQARGDAGLPRGTETILVAEDDAAVRRLTSDILQRFGYRVIEAEDGEDAVRKFASQEDPSGIGLLLFDVIMPKLNGREALLEIRRMRPDVKVLFLSGYTADIVRGKGILDEGMHFVLKPVTMSDLLRSVRTALDS
ncbi:MAG: hypothetical protein OHK006_02180 [Thermodesulfovibrionales bacterium]